jgi:DNA-binding GntR family transcriptional regulator
MICPITLKTAAERVYEELRPRIVRNELTPGTPLQLTELAEELGVSTMPVRSALSALQGEGLVRQVRHRGATVAPLELEDLEVIQAVRAGIEGFAARSGAPEVSHAEVERIGELFERCREIAPVGPLDLYLETQWEMQDICYRAAGRPRLVDLIQQYRRRSERYIRLAVGSRELQQNLPLHETFVRACRDGDGEAAERALCRALAWTVETLRPVIEVMEQEAGATDQEIGSVERA